MVPYKGYVFFYQKYTKETRSPKVSERMLSAFNLHFWYHWINWN